MLIFEKVIRFGWNVETFIRNLSGFLCRLYYIPYFLVQHQIKGIFCWSCPHLFCFWIISKALQIFLSNTKFYRCGVYSVYWPKSTQVQIWLNYGKWVYAFTPFLFSNHVNTFSNMNSAPYCFLSHLSISCLTKQKKAEGGGGGWV